MDPPALERSMQTALEHHRAGRLAAAEALYRQVLARSPEHTEALHLLGVLAGQMGDLEMAIDLIGRASSINPAVARYHCDLGEGLLRSGRPGAALLSVRRAIELRPDLADAHTNLGLVCWCLGRVDDALAALRRATQLDPLHGVAHSALGNLLRDEGRHEEAIATFTHLIRVRPADAQAHNDLGVVLRAAGRLDAATAAFRRAVELRPDHAQAHGNLGVALKQSGLARDAMATFERALQLNPGLARIHVNRSALLIDWGRAGEAIASLRRAIELEPGLAEAHFNLGIALHRSNQLDESIDAHRRALEIQPDHADAHCALGAALLFTGEADKAIGHFRRALQLRPDSTLTHSNLLMCEQYRPGVTLASLARAHADWDRHAAAYLGNSPSRERDRAPERTLRLGFVSADFGSHPVGFFLAHVLEKLGPYPCVVVCYHNRAARDAVTGRLAAAADRWNDVCELDDDALAERIRADRIDVLFDLSGHTAGNRLLVFARRPAPIQVTWIGYPCTTGMTAMDYLIADPFHVPPQSDVHYREAILRLPDTSVCFEPPPEAPAIGPLPALAQGYMTFGSFNNLSKLTPEAIATWAEILRGVPDSRLLLGTWGLGGGRTRARIQEAFAAAGVEPGRVELRGKIRRSELFAAYNDMDIALDPFPYSGGMTTCEALWMGVPVVTLPGETMAGRHSLSHLSNVGLTETIATDRRAYVEGAVRLAQDLPHLAGLRAGLREQMLRSPLCDGERFVQHFMAMVRDVWRRWCGS
jgi:predicted O-linked N-acetylglucosamine transferase (SPINDLY family)